MVATIPDCHMTIKNYHMTIFEKHFEHLLDRTTGTGDVVPLEGCRTTGTGDVVPLWEAIEQNRSL